MTDQVRTMWKGQFDKPTWATSRRATVAIHTTGDRAAATIIGDDGVGHVYDLSGANTLEFVAHVKKQLDDAARHPDRSLAVIFDNSDIRAISGRPPPPPPGPPGMPTDNMLASRAAHAALRTVVELSGVDYLAQGGGLSELGGIAGAAAGAVASIGNTLAATLGVSKPL